MRCAFLVLFLLLNSSSSAQLIYTFAGTGVSMFGGDGGPATAAQISNPVGGVFDKYGNYYFAALTNEKRVRRIDTNGIITTVAGGGTEGDGVPATAARLNAPEAVTLDSIGNLFISDGGNNNIRKVDIITGMISTIAGTGIAGYGGDGGPASAAVLNDQQDICFDRKGNLYICDPNNYRVRKINTLGIVTTFAGNGTLGSSGDGMPATDARLDLPEGIVADDTGNIYIADWGGLANCIRKVDTFGIITTLAGNGNAAYIGDGIPAIDAQFAATRIALDSFNNLYIADFYGQRIYKVDTSGMFYNIAGDGIAGFDGDGGPATAAELYTPTGVALDACGNLYIPETGTLSIDSGNNIRRVVYNSTCDPYHGTLKANSITSKSEISLYPNPAYSQLTITSATNIHEVTITNLIGQQVSSQVYDMERAEVNVAGLPPGVYVVRVTDG